MKPQWCNTCTQTFDTVIEIEAKYREEFLTDLTRKISAMNIKIKSLNTKLYDDNKISVSITLGIKNSEHLKFITDNLLRINGMISVKKV